MDGNFWKTCIKSAKICRKYPVLTLFKIAIVARDNLKTYCAIILCVLGWVDVRDVKLIQNYAVLAQNRRWQT